MDFSYYGEIITDQLEDLARLEEELRSGKVNHEEYVSLKTEMHTNIKRELITLQFVLDNDFLVQD